MKLVLVVDDDPASRDALALVLTLEGFVVEVAATAAEAIARATAGHPAVVLCDLALGPGGDGCSVARALRGHPELPAPRLVALSGADTAAARERARAAGFDAYLLKPVPPHALLAELGVVDGA